MTLALGPTTLTYPGAWGFGRIDGRPFNSDISSPFGPRASFQTPTGWTNPFHNGCDLPAAAGTPIEYPGEGGVVTAEGPAWNGYGNAVFIRDDSGHSLLFAHMQPGLHVGFGQRVLRGSIVGQVGTTGASTGPHLHLGLMQAWLPTISDVSSYVDNALWLDPVHFFTPDITVPVVEPVLSGALPAPGTFALCVTTRTVSVSDIKLYLESDGSAQERALYMLIGGQWSVYVFGAPPAVNAAFPDPVPASTAVLVAA